MEIVWLDNAGIREAQNVMKTRHYLHQAIHNTCSPRGYRVDMCGVRGAAYVMFGRPEATRVNGWYGSVEDIATGKCEVSRWEILNLARMWIDPEFQVGGGFYSAAYLPGFTDRRGVWRSTLASTLTNMTIERVVVDYLVDRPPVYLDEPYELKYILSYCDLRVHKGTLYRSAGFELVRENKNRIQTYRKRTRALTSGERDRVRQASLVDARAIMYRAKREQLATAM